MSHIIISNAFIYCCLSNVVQIRMVLNLAPTVYLLTICSVLQRLWTCLRTASVLKPFLLFLLNGWKLFQLLFLKCCECWCFTVCQFCRYAAYQNLAVSFLVWYLWLFFWGGEQSTVSTFVFNLDWQPDYGDVASRYYQHSLYICMVVPECCEDDEVEKFKIRPHDKLTCQTP